MCECGQGLRTGGHQSGCVECERIDRERYRADRTRDRVLARVRHERDWITASDVADDIDIARFATFHHLESMVKDGTIEQKRIPRYGVVYRAKKEAA
jgi:predicted transcriptional regulator